jgi:hypothetical protein
MTKNNKDFLEEDFEALDELSEEEIIKKIEKELNIKIPKDEEIN